MKHLPKDLTRKFSSDSARIDPAFKESLRNNLFKGEQSMSKQDNSNGFINRLKRTNLGPVFAVLIVLVFVGSTSAAVTSSRLNNQREQERALPADLAATLSIDDIRAIALADVPGGSINGIELEQEDGKLLYKVKFSDGSFRLYNASTGELVNKNEFETDDSVPSGFVPGITLQEARTIAQSKRPGKTITKIELEVEEGVVVYSVRFSDDGRVDVNANDGSIMRVRDDDNSDDSSSSESDDSSDDSSDDNSGSGSDDDSDDDSDEDSSDDSSDDSDDDTDDDSDDDSNN